MDQYQRKFFLKGKYNGITEFLGSKTIKDPVMLFIIKKLQ